MPLNSINKLDFKKSLQKEIEKSLEEVRVSEQVVQRKIGRDLKEYKIALRNHIISIRDNLREDFDAFSFALTDEEMSRLETLSERAAAYY